MDRRKIRNAKRVVISAAATLLLSIAYISPAQAAVPANDDRANAIILADPLPITAIGDSTEATAQDPTDPIENCTGVQTQYTVWYQYTPSDTGTIAFDISSDYSALAAFFRVTNSGDLEQVACAGNATTINLTGGQTYLIMIGACCGGPLRGGTFSFSLSAPPPPLEILVTVDAASYNTRTGVVYLTGTHTCNTPTNGSIGLSGTIRQVNKKANTVIEDGFSVPNAGACAPTTRSWSATVTGQHAYALTSLFVTVQAFGCAQFTCDDATVSKTVELTKQK